MRDVLDHVGDDLHVTSGEEAAAAAAGDALGEFASATDTYGSLPSWNIVVICTVGGVLFFELICHQVQQDIGIAYTYVCINCTVLFGWVCRGVTLSGPRLRRLALQRLSRWCLSHCCLCVRWKMWWVQLFEHVK